jgi:hypothetical protein
MSSPKFGTQVDAQGWAKANAIPTNDIVMHLFANSAINN